MATASFSTVAKDDLSCPVCFELLRDPYTPKLLDCPHLCCAVCIRKMVDGGKETIECPECRGLTLIPDGGVDAMRTVLRVRSLAEKHQEMMRKNVQDVLVQQEKKIDNVIPTKCPTHHWSAVDFYCKNCNIIGCNVCMKNMHQGGTHCVLKISATREGQRQQLDSIIKRVHEKVEVFQREAKRLNDIRSEINGTIKEQSKLIDTRKEYAIGKINEESTFLKMCIRKKAESRLDMINQEIDLLRMETEGLIEAMSVFRNTVEESDQLELVMKHEDLAQNIQSLMEKKVKTNRYGNPSLGITKYNDYKDPLPHDMKDITLNIFPERILKCELRDHECFKLVENVVAGLGNVFVVHDAKKQKLYEVFHGVSYNNFDAIYEYSKQRSLNKLNPHGSTINSIAVTTCGQYLVARESHVDIYSADQKHEGEFKFRNEGKSSNDSNQYATKIVAMNDDTGRVVVGDEHNRTLTVSRDQVVLRAFQLCHTPMRMCSMSNGMIAVCNRQHGKIAIVDIESGKEMHFLKIPHVAAACYHPNLDSLIVVRNTAVDENGRELLRSGVIEQYGVVTGRFITRLAEGLYNPQDVAISNDLQNIAVADSKMVPVYNIS